jgi:hypothetical protein
MEDSGWEKWRWSSLERMELPDSLKERFLGVQMDSVYCCGGCSALTVNPARELFKCTACQNTTNFKDDDPLRFQAPQPGSSLARHIYGQQDWKRDDQWQATRNWELLVDPNLFCLSESKQTKIKQSSSCIGVIYHQ